MQAGPSPAPSSGGLGIGIACAGAIIALANFSIGARKEKREALFKCFEGYLKVRDYRHDAKNDADLRRYFRAVLDLQWTQYELWADRKLPPKQYEVWLRQRVIEWNEPISNDFSAMAGWSPKPILTSPDSRRVARQLTLGLVWEQLLEQKYFDSASRFAEHIENARRTDPDGTNKTGMEKALKDRGSFWVAFRA